MRWQHFLPVALGFLLFGREPVLAQPALSEAQQYQARVDEAVRALTSHPSLKNVPAQKRQQLAEFVVGNVSFAFLHEMAHGLVHEMELPVLGKEEDAADTFAIVTMLKLGTSLSHPMLVEAAKAWFLTDKRDQREGTQPDAYDAHGLDDQRAYRIVCLLVGSNKEQFKDLADQTNLPEERRETCRLYDFPVASLSWEKALQSHRRGSEQPRQQIEIKYWPGKGDLNVYEQTFRAVRILETVANYAAEEYSWPHPLGLEMATCGESGAQFQPSTRKVLFCYELAHEFAQLYRDYGQEWNAPPQEKWWHPKWWKRAKKG
jgi:hypothetical protein